MFRDASSFNQDLSLWCVTNLGLDKKILRLEQIILTNQKSNQFGEHVQEIIVGRDQESPLQRGIVLIPLMKVIKIE